MRGHLKRFDPYLRWKLKSGAKPKNFLATDNLASCEIIKKNMC